MEKTGFNVNETLWNFYESEEMGMYKRGNGGTIATASAVVTEVPWNEYTDEVKDSVSSYGDAAIVTLSRVGGEGADLAYGDVNYLALDDNEKEMLSNVAAMKAVGTVSKIIVLINSANALQVDFLKDNTYNVDACLWIGDVGITGINAVADILALLSPERISIGGGAANDADLLLPLIRKHTSRLEFLSSSGRYDIVPCETLDDAVFIGAALYARDGFGVIA